MEQFDALMSRFSAITGIEEQTARGIALGLVGLIVVLMIVYWIAKFALDVESRGSDLGCVLKLLLVGALAALVFMIVLSLAGWPFGME
ncbi:MAG: hypothetical protein HOH43_13715 [Candidatus Latescibacteria bacterium]|jgi:hypothetical protein|nr:hypothetical protein [Candidatus Latescibacterota bacterium]